MAHFGAIPAGSVLGRLLRLPLRLLPRNLVVPICQGRLKGRKWVIGAAQHGCWLGSSEFHQQRRLAEIVQPGWVFFDIGANVGFYTLLASVLVQDAGRVYAFEPCPRNTRYLEKHVAINKTQNVTVFRAAVGDHSGECRFEEAEDSAMGRVSETGGIAVQVVALDELHAEGVLPLPNVMKIDVEGAEAPVLRGAQRMLTVSEPIISAVPVLRLQG